jgi:hypothetical protein
LLIHACAQGIEFGGCGCAASEFGCCPDGNSTATGDNFQVKIYNIFLDFFIFLLSPVLIFWHF